MSARDNLPYPCAEIPTLKSYRATRFFYSCFVIMLFRRCLRSLVGSEWPIFFQVSPEDVPGSGAVPHPFLAGGGGVCDIVRGRGQRRDGGPLARHARADPAPDHPGGGALRGQHAAGQAAFVPADVRPSRT